MHRRMAGLVRLPVPGEVEKEDLESPLGEIGGQAAAELVVEEQAVEEHEDPVPLSVALVVQAQALELEARLLEGTVFEEPRHEGDRPGPDAGHDRPRRPGAPRPRSRGLEVPTPAPTDVTI